jgi:hypothetical protein
MVVYLRAGRVRSGNAVADFNPLGEDVRNGRGLYSLNYDMNILVLCILIGLYRRGNT